MFKVYKIQIKGGNMKFIDDSKKTLNFWNRNYCFLATILYVTLNIILFVTCEGGSYKTFDGDLMTILHNLKVGYIHNSWHHVLLNMATFFFLGFYIERKEGTFKLLAIILVCSLVFATIPTGHSAMWAFLIGWMLINYLFSFKKDTRNKTNIIVGAVVLVLEIVRCCFYDLPGGGIAITYYPYQIITHLSHFRPFVWGLLVCLLVELSKLITLTQYKYNEPVVVTPSKPVKAMYALSVLFVFGLLVATAFVIVV